MAEPVPLEAFFTHGDPPCSHGHSPSDATLASPPSASSVNSSSTSSIVYLHGPPHAGQTSLLLQYGFTQAKREQTVVLIMCGGEDAESRHKPVIVPISPCPKCGVPTQTGGDSLILRRIQIKYLRNSSELQQFLCSFHLVKEKSSVLLIDGLERFFGSDSFMGNVYQTLAYLYETLLFMQTSTGSGQVVVTGASDSFILQGTFRNALRRWCSFLEIREDVSSGGGEFVLREGVELTTEDDDMDDDDEEQDAKVPRRIQIHYEYSPPDTRHEGNFQLLDVEILPRRS